jgi:hypothetical protein
MPRLANRVILMIGDSSLRNQFVQLTRVGLAIPRDMPVTTAINQGSYRGSFSFPGPTRMTDRPDSSNGYWGGFPWLVVSTSENVTFMYAKLWGCSDVRSIAHRVRSAARRHRQIHQGRGGWPPDVVLWNFGLHLLHVYPARPVPTAALKCALSYETLVDSSAKELRELFPASRMYYRTTNAVCDARFDGSWAVAAHAYHCVMHPHLQPPGVCRNDRLARVRESCKKRYNLTIEQCVASFMDENNTRMQRRMALNVLSTHSARIQMLDAFVLTERRCDATVDGRHYPRLISAINMRLLSDMLSWREGGRG